MCSQAYNRRLIPVRRGRGERGTGDGDCSLSPSPVPWPPRDQNDKTQPPLPLLKALLHSDCTGNVPVLNVVLADAP